MGRLVLGVLLGALLAVAYVHYDWQLPRFLQLPKTLEGNLVSSATESALYDFNADTESRRRALEVYFANRAESAAKLDADAGHPFLTALVAERARREARQLMAIDEGSELALSKPALREALERKHGTNDPAELKTAMRMQSLGERPFLKAWLERNVGPITGDNLTDALKQAARAPAP